ncbi:aminopeptidase RNPEPL1 isoform X2 [Ascaphus truei]|uniref:aminopeptidase RNPEPL1 isoform X2 n=1 Tax=Ascaphus truei TaxID=8439 RepID=UPI003F595AE5
MSSAAAAPPPCPALCCCPLHPGPSRASHHGPSRASHLGPSRASHHGPSPASHPGPTPASPPRCTPDPASASSFQLFRLHHFHLGLELRPEARELDGCLVLELSPLLPGAPALVLDTHPALRVSSVRWRRGGGRERPVSDRSCPPYPAGGCQVPPNDLARGCPLPPNDLAGGCQLPPNDLAGGCPLPPNDLAGGCPASPDHLLGSDLQRPESPLSPLPNDYLWYVTSASPDPLSDGSPGPMEPLCVVNPGPGEHPSEVSPGPAYLPAAWSPALGPLSSVWPGVADRSHSLVIAASSPDCTGCPCPSVNGHPPPPVSLGRLCPASQSPSVDLSSRSSSSCYSLSPESAVASAPESSFFAATSPPYTLAFPFSPSLDIPGSTHLPITSCSPCGVHGASDSVPAHSTCCFPLDFRVDEFTDYGSALTISVPENLRPNETFHVIIHYSTGEGPAVWWLDPELTYGSSHLFVFTQGHSVCNRSFFPCFDTPAVKCTYSATVKAPAGIQVLMSCTQSYYLEEQGAYHFHMEHPVPAYLVALAAGHLLPADIGPRSRVWAEPCVLPLAARKLAGRVEQWLQAAESLYGPYIWGRYDIVFLPPSFPIVAMENPCLTFVICSILDSEDFLLIDVIHEIAHGWFGNAVTNASWEEMWLSEGLATYAQRRITTRIYGAAFTCLETAFRLEALHRQIRLLGQDTPFSKLQVKLDPGVNPSNLMNLFTYEKGFCFVHYLSQMCGDPDNFDTFLRDYIDKYKFRSVVAQDLLESYLSFFPRLRGESTGGSEGLEFERWLSAPGPPLLQPDLSQGSMYTAPVEALSELWLLEPLDVGAVASSADITGWQTFQTVLFLDRLLDKSPLRPEVMLQLSLCYSAVLDTMNPEIRIRWLQVVVRNNFQPDLPRVRHFLLCQTSRMYTIPLYEDLSSGPLKSCALEIFCQTHGRLHPNLRKTIQQILAQGVSTAQPDTALPVPTAVVRTQCPAPLRDVNVTA